MNEVLEGLGITSAWLNVPGFLGFLPAQTELPAEFGAFLPPPLTKSALLPLPNRCALESAGGVLLHTGLPNPGFEGSLHKYGKRWARLKIPVWLELLPGNIEEAAAMAEQVDELDFVLTYQVSLPRKGSPREKADMLAAMQGETPFWLEIPLDQVNKEAIRLAQESAAIGIVVTAPRASLPGPSGLVSGRLYGPCLYPLMIQALRSVLRSELPVIAGCGVGTLEQGQQLLQYGAAAVQVDTLLWL